jgi:hypothetical protein
MHDRHGPSNSGGAGGSRQSHTSRSRRSKSRSNERHERDREGDRHHRDDSQQHNGLNNSTNNEDYERKRENGGIDGISKSSTAKKGNDKDDNIQGGAKGDVLAVDDNGMNNDINENAAGVGNSSGDKISSIRDDSPLSPERKRRRIRNRHRNNRNS